MNTEKQIEFDKIKTMWADLAVTEYAKEKIEETEIILDEKELRRALLDTTNSRRMIEELGNPPVQNVTEITEVLAIAERGDCLTPYQLERVGSVLAAVERLIDYLRRGQKDGNPLAYYDENLDPLNELRDEIARQIRAEAVDDRASKELLNIRNQIMTTEDAMKQKAEQIIRSNKDCMADSYYTIVEDSSAEEVSIIDTVVEDVEIEEENEVYRILYTLTAMVSDAKASIEEDIRMIEKLDYIFSKGKLSIDLGAVEPRINLERRIDLVKARHPLMDKSMAVPLNFNLGGDTRGIVITGPNTGGKTVAIKTVMINCYMAQCGLHVTAEDADICMNSGYLSDIGDGQNLSENLSTFSAHIKNVMDILSVINRDSIIIMDELGSGTDPAEGMGIAVAILEELRKSEANFLVTTHYPEVKDYADRTEHIVNARMTFDKETLRPTYKMVIGEAGESCAFYIADRLGMSEEMLRTAVEAAYGKDAVESFKFRDRQNDKRQTSKKQLPAKKITKMKKQKQTGGLSEKFKIGDSVMVYPDKKIGIVCEPVNEKGIMRVQVADRKIYINHKRVKLHVRAEELYPADYDFSIIFDSVKNRKVRHDMGRKLTDEIIVYEDDGKNN